MIRHFSNEEDAIILIGIQKDMSDAEIAAQISSETGSTRSRRAIRDRRRLLGIQRECPHAVLDHGINHKENDLAFFLAMSQAIAKGMESAAIGIIKDDTPFVGKRVQPDPIFSPCGSSAALAVTG